MKALYGPRGLWFATLLGGLALLLFPGFLASAVANRWIFAAWALVSATGYALVVRWSFRAGNGLGMPLFAISAGLGGFLVLVWLYEDYLHLGLTALLPVGETP